MEHRDFKEDLKALLNGADYDTIFIDANGVKSVDFTLNDGIIAKMNDGSTFVINITKTK